MSYVDVKLDYTIRGLYALEGFKIDLMSTSWCVDLSTETVDELIDMALKLHSAAGVGKIIVDRKDQDLKSAFKAPGHMGRQVLVSKCASIESKDTTL